jgi:hypothetical protein
MEDTVLIDARVRLLVSAAAVILFANAAPERVSAQSSLDVAQAREFLGHWLVNFQNGQGAQR